MSAEALARIEEKLDLLLRSQPQLLTTAQAASFLGCASSRAFHRVTERLGIKPVMRGRYQLTDLENSLARLALSK